MMYGWHGSWMYGFGGLWMLLWLLVVVAVVYLVLRFTRRTDASTGRTSSTALDILKERYARGEIDRETYERMRDELR